MSEIVLLLIAMSLVPTTALETVLTTVLAGARLASRQASLVPAGKRAISRARYRWGVRPLVDLFHRVCQPLATPATKGAWLFGLRVVALDGSREDMADTPENERAFGRHRSQHGPRAFPQLLGMYLVECGTHAILDAGIWPCHANEHRAARRLLRSITAAMLVLWDSGVHRVAVAPAVLQRGAQCVGRVPAHQPFEPVRALADGSMLAWLYAAPPSRRTATTARIMVRVITSTITDPQRPGCGEQHRLMTSLLDPAHAPALELVCAYHERFRNRTGL